MDWTESPAASRSLDRIQRDAKTIWYLLYVLHDIISSLLALRRGQPLWNLHGFASQERVDLFKKN